MKYENVHFRQVIKTWWRHIDICIYKILFEKCSSENKPHQPQAIPLSLMNIKGVMEKNNG